MQIRPIHTLIEQGTQLPLPKPSLHDPAPSDHGLSDLALSEPTSKEPPGELQEAFTEFVGNTLFGSMLASMRKTVGKPAYMHGGRTEEIFQKQLDQKIVEELTEASADQIADPMFELFQLRRS